MVGKLQTQCKTVRTWISPQLSPGVQLFYYCVMCFEWYIISFSLDMINERNTLYYVDLIGFV